MSALSLMALLSPLWIILPFFMNLFPQLSAADAWDRWKCTYSSSFVQLPVRSQSLLACNSLNAGGVWGPLGMHSLSMVQKPGQCGMRGPSGMYSLGAVQDLCGVVCEVPLAFTHCTWWHVSQGDMCLTIRVQPDPLQVMAGEWVWGGV